jgi:phosphate transport system protein
MLKLGGVVEKSLERAIHSLQNQNTAVALWVIENDLQIDELRHNLEERVITLLATQQPVVAHDLRLLSMVSAIVTELERIGDYATGIARRVHHNPDRMAQIEWSPKINRMAEITQQMLHTSLDALLQQNEDMARQLGQTDNEVDSLRDVLRNELVDVARNDTRYIDAVVDLLDIINLLERAADRTTNIGERVIYLITSEVEEINP